SKPDCRERQQRQGANDQDPHSVRTTDSTALIVIKNEVIQGNSFSADAGGGCRSTLFWRRSIRSGAMGSRDAPRTRTLEACATPRRHPAGGVGEKFWGNDPIVEIIGGVRLHWFLVMVVS